MRITGQPYSSDPHELRRIHASLRLERMPSLYAQFDHPACREVLNRLVATACAGTLIPEHELTQGIVFTLRRLDGQMERRTLGLTAVSPTQRQDSGVLHDYTRYLAARSFFDDRVLLNALVIRSKQQPFPPDGFHPWAHAVGAIGYSTGPEERKAYWLRELQKLHTHYQALPN